MISKLPAKPPKVVKAQVVTEQEEFDFMKGSDEYKLPGISFLNNPKKRPANVDDENLKMRSKLVEKNWRISGCSARFQPYLQAR